MTNDDRAMRPAVEGTNRRFPGTYALLELVPVAGIVAMLLAFGMLRSMVRGGDDGGSDSSDPELPLVIEVIGWALVVAIVVFVIALVLFLFATVFVGFIATFAAGIGWIASGRVFTGIAIGVSRGVLTFAIYAAGRNDDNPALIDGTMGALIVQLTLLSIASAVVLWVVEIRGVQRVFRSVTRLAEC